MNRRNTLTLTTMALLCFTVALPSGDAAAQQKTLKEQLAGVWTYVSTEITPPNGTKQPFIFGANPKGILILDAGGRYADLGACPSIRDHRFRREFDSEKAAIKSRTFHCGYRSEHR